MERTFHQAEKTRARGVRKALLLVAFIILAVYVVRYTPVSRFLSREVLSNFLGVPVFGLP